ncbi:MAG: carbohydrate kinase [Chitinophagaceae bacterium]|nr:carbohydrate kinase [Chitinophagaceae bacterium]
MNFTCVCFGEVLFDVLPHEIKAGGAPMNVAYHLTVLGQSTALISRVGNDDRGKALTAILKEKKLHTEYIQVDATHPTGIVMAMPDAAGDMKYDIKQGVAWDYIEPEPQHEALVKNAGYFIFGSLITRSKISCNTLFNLLDNPVTRVFDVNLRQPFTDQSRLEYQFSKADILKMNEEELDLITEWYVQFKTIEDKIRFLQNRFQVPDIIVTRGAKGAVINSNDDFYYHDGYRVRVADTIGSGDSFVAGYLSGIINHKSPAEALQFASALGAFVATQTGGCPSYTSDDIQRFIQSQSSMTS